jgi:hypothetical protein
MQSPVAPAATGEIAHPAKLIEPGWIAKLTKRPSIFGISLLGEKPGEQAGGAKI